MQNNKYINMICQTKANFKPPLMIFKLLQNYMQSFTWQTHFLPPDFVTLSFPPVPLMSHTSPVGKIEEIRLSVDCTIITCGFGDLLISRHFIRGLSRGNQTKVCLSGKRSNQSEKCKREKETIYLGFSFPGRPMRYI